MRTAEQIEMGFREAVKTVTDTFIGKPLTEDTVKNLQSAVVDAAIDYYMELTETEIETYRIAVPRPKVIVNGNAILIDRGF